MGFIQTKQLVTKNGATYSIRTALPANANKILMYTKMTMRESKYLLTTEEEFQFSVEQEEKFLHEMLNGQGNLAIVAECNDQIIAFLNFQNGQKKRIQHQGVFGMSVAKAYQNQGIGKAMLESLLDWAKENPLIEKVSLEVFARNANAIALYKKVGFEEEGRKRKETKMNNDYDDLILMACFTKE